MSEPTNKALFSYPPQAAFGRPLPKNKLYEKSGANTRLKDLFVSQVDQIVWQYKLAPETINLTARPGVPEVQVFSIHLKAVTTHVARVDQTVGIDPTTNGGELRMTALILAACIIAGVFIRWAVLNDNLDALENLDDEALAAQAVEAWEARK